MILVDTSVWIEVLRGRAGDRYRAAVAGEQVVTCLPVIQEVLQGIDPEHTFRVASRAFADIHVLENPLTRDVFADAVQLYRDARRSAITIRSGVDCLIAACAMRNGATVLHVDRDFTHLAQIAELSERRF
ncbi:MAG TPA: PIN domain-containing protein [Thermoanaerobaculia bacterium]|nr:PIN domain-containing protein [Thermoanaerobaculia bacterium]